MFSFWKWKRLAPPVDLLLIPSTFIQADAEQMLRIEMLAEEDFVDINTTQLTYAEVAHLANRPIRDVRVKIQRPTFAQRTVAGCQVAEIIPVEDVSEEAEKEDYWTRNQHFKQKQFDSVKRKKAKKKMSKMVSVE